MTTRHTRRRRLTISLGGSAATGAVCALLYAAAEHTSLLINLLLGTCVTGLLVCCVVAPLHAMSRPVRPLPLDQVKALPAVARRPARALPRGVR